MEDKNVLIRVCSGFWLILAKTTCFDRVKGPKGDKISVFLCTCIVLNRVICFLLGFSVHCTWPESLIFFLDRSSGGGKGKSKNHTWREGEGEAGIVYGSVI